MLKKKYDEITIEAREELGLIGMHVKIDRPKKTIILTQPKQVA